jgi:hypothetical protein
MGVYYGYKANLIFAHDQIDLIRLIEESRVPYDSALDKLYKKKDIETLTEVEKNSIDILTVFLKGITDFIYFLKNNSYCKDKLYEVEREMDLYFLHNQESTEDLILIQQKKIVDWLEKNKIVEINN